MSKSFLWSAVIVISLLCVGGVAASRLHSSATDTFVTSAVSIDPDEIQATIKGLPEQQFVDLI
jgi:hypothetical protein